MRYKRGCRVAIGRAFLPCSAFLQAALVSRLGPNDRGRSRETSPDKSRRDETGAETASSRPISIACCRTYIRGEGEG